MRSPRPKKIANWRDRWCSMGKRWTMHRVSDYGIPYRKWRDWCASDNVTTVCGRKGRGWVPGIFTRLAGNRCANCCRALGLPSGKGAPFNAFRDHRRDA